MTALRDIEEALDFWRDREHDYAAQGDGEPQVTDRLRAKADRARAEVDRLIATLVTPSTKGHTHDPERVECLPPHGAGAHNRCPRCGGYYFRCEDPYHDAATPSTEGLLTDDGRPEPPAESCAHPFDRLYQRGDHIVCDACGYFDPRLNRAATPTEHPAGLDVERLARAMWEVRAGGSIDNRHAADVAAEYARLSDQPTETGEQG